MDKPFVTDKSRAGSSLFGQYNNLRNKYIFLLFYLMKIVIWSIKKNKKINANNKF